MIRIVELELNAPPEIRKTDGIDLLLVIVLHDGVPLGMLEIHSGDRLCAGDLVRKARSAFPVPPSEKPLPVAARPSVTVVICTCGRPEDLSLSLDALKGQSRPPEEVVVVDNAPGNPATRHLLENRFGWCRYVEEPRRGVTFARNRGICAAREDIVAFLDDDCRPLPGWLDGIASAFARYPEAGCCTGPVLPAELSTRAQILIERRGGFNRGFHRQLFTPESGRRQWKHYPLQAWMFGTGGNMAFRRAVLRELGGFDAVLPTGEDIEMFSRVLRGEHSLVYEPAAAVRHRHVADYRALRRRLFLWGEGYVAYLAKVALDDPRYRKKALGELAGWFGYQLRERLLGGARRTFPLDLIAAEMVGGLFGGPGYLWRRLRVGTDGRCIKPLSTYKG